MCLCGTDPKKEMCKICWKRELRVGESFKIERLKSDGGGFIGGRIIEKTDFGYWYISEFDHSDIKKGDRLFCKGAQNLRTSQK